MRTELDKAGFAGGEAYPEDWRWEIPIDNPEFGLFDRAMDALRLVSWLSFTLFATPAAAFTFAEGTSSAEPGVPAAVFYRAFTIYTGQEACARSPVPASLTVRLKLDRFGVGTRVHRDASTELVVEAYDAVGTFLPSVPVSVSVVADADVIGSRSDWDYFEVLRPGDVELVVRWWCGVVRGSVLFSVRDQ